MVKSLNFVKTGLFSDRKKRPKHANFAGRLLNAIALAKSIDFLISGLYNCNGAIGRAIS